MTGSESSHLDCIGFIPLLIAAYFLIAAFLPRIRMRWGLRYGVNTKTLQPHMGMITCLGNAIFIGSVSLPMIWNQVAGELVAQGFFAGFALTAVGAVLDWLREPTITRKKNRRK
ncbi:hypothetical protein [Pedosphaera parvula]|uniref:Uncharacterized protein n=1 Tax=Pedosphaera parvula (strain Ellin514) TaxID=320771 RepID=B9XJJ1_PEDPL|nr:hypothetical protein [Pedosphaera parvula]EEF60052.1 hypothetical protein Cflav_PD3111 [Pedosphaera parvula Ellin514]